MARPITPTPKLNAKESEDFLKQVVEDLKIPLGLTPTPKLPKLAEVQNIILFKRMIEAAMKIHPESFIGFETNKNIQNQLQEMLIDHVNRTVFEGCGNDRSVRIGIHCDLYAFTNQIYEEAEYPIYPTNVFDTQEQLWLACVMNELFNEKWNDEDWDNPPS